MKYDIMQFMNCKLWSISIVYYKDFTAYNDGSLDSSVHKLKLLTCIGREQREMRICTLALLSVLLPPLHFSIDCYNHVR